MRALAANGMGRSNLGLSHWPRAATALLLAATACSVLALDDRAALEAATSSVDAAIGSTGQRLQLELSASSLPRFDSSDGSTRASRIDLTWLPPRRSALGLSLGMTSSEGSMFAPMRPAAGTASVDLGLRWRYTLDSNYRVDVTAWRRLVPPDALTLVQTHESSYGARVEMQLGSIPKSGFVADRGFIGFQLESGARVTVRRSGGRPMIYYRTRF